MSKSITGMVLNDFIGGLLREGKRQVSGSKKQHRKEYQNLKRYSSDFNYGLDLYELDIKNPADRLKKRAVEKKIKFIPSDDQIDAVKAICDDQEKLMIDFALESGGRIGEILRFKREDMQNDSIYLYTRKTRHSDLVGRKLPIVPCIKTLQWQGRLFKRWTEYPRFLEKKVKQLNQPFWAWHCAEIKNWMNVLSSGHFAIITI